MKKNSLLIGALIFIGVVFTIIINNLMNGGGQYVGTFWAIIPALVAITLALITKEAYSSLFAGGILGALLASRCSFTGTVDLITVEGLSNAVSNNAGIYLFLVILGVVVAIMNESNMALSFGTWAENNIKTKTGASVATFVLGVLIFIDDYFNCLTVGSVMSPITDKKKMSRVKLAYLIDATAAPVCMIAPISSWAAAVSGCVESDKYSGIELFIKAIPYNFYSILTFVFVICLIYMKFDYGKMRKYEQLAETKGELSIIESSNDIRNEGDKSKSPGRGRVFDLILITAILIVFCVWGLLHNGYQTIGSGSVIDAFSSTDSYVGLPWGSLLALVVIMIYVLARRIMSFEEMMKCIPKGFVTMVPPMIILTLATGLKNMTNMLMLSDFIGSIMENVLNFQWLLPAVVFVVGAVVSFATGTSWGTFGILIPIVSAVFSDSSSLFFVGISACLAGAVCGDHCSPISDTTIMSSAGAACEHLEHVTTQFPYALTVAVISFVNYIVVGALDKINMKWLSLPIGVAMIIVTLCVIKNISEGKEFD